MDKYKINYIYDENNDINDIFIKILNKELKKYIQVICKNEKCEVPSSCTYLKKEVRIVRKFK